MFIIDWLTFTSKIDSVSSILQFLKLENYEFQELPNGRHGYHDGLYLDGINIYYNPCSESMGICIDMSGTGCRAFEDYSKTNFKDIFDLILSDEDSYNITRLDIAFDDKEGIIPIKQLASDVEKQNYISKWSSWKVTNSSDGLTIDIGSNKSDAMIRIYDKALERGFIGADYIHWIRLELQLRRSRAMEFIRELQYTDLGKLWTGVVYNYLRFVIPNNSDTNKARWKMRKYWFNLINNAEKIKLFTYVGMEYNYDNLSNYVFKQAVGAIKTSMQLMGSVKFFKAVKETKIKLNPKYEMLLLKHKNERLKHENIKN